MKEISVIELQTWRTEQKDHQLIDIREDYEFEAGNLGGLHIPMGTILERCSELRRDVPVVLQCRSGGRSAAVLTALEDRFGFENLYNLKGGAKAWAAEVDSSLEVA
jgi:adenylyltransferase/sulfurtransferase